MLYIVNAFSLNMLPDEVILFRPVMLHASKRFVIDAIRRAQENKYEGVECAIGHPDTARVVMNDLGLDLPCERKAITFRPGADKLIVAQYRGPRLPEGATELPDDATIEYWFVEE